MSDTTNSTDPMLSYLEERRETLLLEIREREAKLIEVNHLIDVARDGRSRVNRQRKTRTAGNSTAHGLATTPELQAAAQQIAADWEGEVRGNTATGAGEGA